MLLDYNPATSAFILNVPRPTTEIKMLVEDFGLDFSTSATTTNNAVLFTKEPYCAASFFEYGTPAAKGQLQALITQVEASRALDNRGHFRVPADKELWGFQKASLAYALARTHCLVGDQPGLGKTPIAVAYANEIGARRALVICPASIRYQWAKVIREWSTLPWPFHIHLIRKGKDGTHPNAAWTICSYDLAASEPIGKGLAKGDYDVIILDEAHYLKTYDARRTRAIFGGGEERTFSPHASRGRHILALTGTPLPNRPREAYTLARNLCWDAIDWMSEQSFRDRFNPSKRGERYDQETGRKIIFTDERTGRHSELQNRLRANFMVRHLKREVMPQLKLPVFDLIQLEETGPVKQALAAERLLDLDPEALQGKDISAFGEIATVRRMMGLALAPQIADYIDMLVDGGEEKLVVFAWHTEVLDILEKAWLKHNVLRVDGSTSPKRKQHYVELFQQSPRHQIILGNTLSLGTGTDGLQKVSSHGFLAEPDWTPGNNEQAFDRLDRGGQTRQVQCDIFVAPGSFAERILAQALRKYATTNKVLDARPKMWDTGN